MVLDDERFGPHSLLMGGQIDATLTKVEEAEQGLRRKEARLARTNEKDLGGRRRKQ